MLNAETPPPGEPGGGNVNVKVGGQGFLGGLGFGCGCAIIAAIVIIGLLFLLWWLGGAFLGGFFY